MKEHQPTGVCGGDFRDTELTTLQNDVKTVVLVIVHQIFLIIVHLERDEAPDRMLDLHILLDEVDRIATTTDDLILEG
jgi:hypothetical protein